MKFIITYKCYKNERGIALLFALSILALLLVMALAFTTNSMFEKKAAFNSAKGSSSRLLAQAALQTVRVMLATYNSDEVKCSKGVINTQTNKLPLTANTGTYDMLDYLTTYSGRVALFKWDETAYKNFINWQYVKSGTAASSPIIGRYAFVIQPAYGIDANYLTKSTTPGVDEGGYNEERIGVEYNEMNVRSVSESDISTTMAGNFNYTPAIAPAPAGKFSGDWVDYATMFDASHLNITDGATQNKFRKWFVIGANKSKEAFWVDKNDDKAKNSGELHHRFNLKRTVAQWNAMGSAYPPQTMYKQILLDSNYDGNPDTLPTVWNNANNDGMGIPWLAFVGYDKNGALDASTANHLYANFAQDSDNVAVRESGIIARRRQIAANLVDYCDTDSKPTSDVDPANWATTTPTFTGDEKTAYINELVIDVAYTTSSIDKGGSANPRYDHDATLTVTLSAEIVDIYGIGPKHYTISVYGERQIGGVKIDGSLGLAAESAFVAFPGNPIAGVLGDLAGKGYSYATLANNVFHYDSSNAPVSTVSTNVAQATFKYGDINIKLDKIILNNGTNNIDIANFNNYVIHIPAMTLAGAGNVQYYISKTLSVKDPRQNLNAGGADLDWKNDIPYQGAWGSLLNAQNAAGVTLGASNQNLDYSTVYTAAPSPKELDNETSNNQDSVSTAYIRNAPMESPWELGFIHRGAPYQTINLTEYDPNKAVKYVSGTPSIIPGGGKFSDPTNGGGDANILDQVKMTNAYEKKKININTQYVDPDTGKNFVLQTLLNQIRIGCTPDTTMSIASMADDGAGVSKIDITSKPDDIDAVVSAIATRSAGINYLTRAEVANCKSSGGTFALSDGTCGITQDTNAKQEELIGKFINLTDVSGTAEYFNVIILAQTIKDVGGGVIIKLGGTNVTTAYGQFDYIYSGGNYYYADKITSQQKVKALLYLDSGTGECKILRYEYVE